MSVYGDLYMLMNGLCDALLLLLTGALTGRRPKKRKIALGALIGAVYSLITLYLPRAAGVLLSLPVSLGMILAVFSYGNIRRFLLSALIFYLSSFFASGVAQYLYTLFGAHLPPPLPALLLIAALFFALFLALLFDELQRRRAPSVLRLSFTYGGRAYALDALPDTGNLLSDAQTGLPVVLLCARILPAPPAHCRTIGVRTAAGRAVLPLLTPEKLSVGGVEQEALLAVCDDLSAFGEYYALLPASLSLAAGGRLGRGKSSGKKVIGPCSPSERSSAGSSDSSG